MPGSERLNLSPLALQAFDMREHRRTVLVVHFGLELNGLEKSKQLLLL